jgi:hypothetical protein
MGALADNRHRYLVGFPAEEAPDGCRAAMAEDCVAPELENRGHFTPERLDGRATNQVDAFVVLVEPTGSQPMTDRASAQASSRQLLANGKSPLGVRDARDFPITGAANVL